MTTAILKPLRLTGLFLLFLLNANKATAQLDTIPPVLTLKGYDTVRIEVGSTYVDSGATAFDDADGDISLSIVMNTDLDVIVTGIYSVTYNVMDNSGNKALPLMRIVIVVNDLTLPVITLNPGNTGCIELNCYNPPYIDPGASAVDNKWPFNLSSSIIVSGNVNTRRIGTYTLTYTVQDPAGNKAIPQTRNVCVESTREQGFMISPINNGYRIWTDSGMEYTRTHFKWYMDGKYLSGYDTTYELLVYLDDSLDHQICMDETFCDDDTAYRFCKIFGDTVQSPISGKIYLDANNDCNNDLGENNLSSIPVRLLDNNGKLVAKTYSYNGDYAFHVDHGQYEVVLDVEKTPLKINCPFPGKDTLIELKQGQMSISHLDFPVGCKPGYDIGVIQGPVASFAIPGQKFYVNPRIGDINAMYGSGCGSTQSGKIKISVQGKAHFIGSDTNAITPDSIQGKNFVYLVNNYALLEPSGIKLVFETDTLANIGDTIKVLISVSPDLNDNNPDNNVVLHHFIVRTSFDPNMKEVYPIDVEPGYSDWMTYTVHFQNTGNAPAFKVRITDTLDGNIDAASFEVLGFSHPAKFGLKGQALVFHFPDINLPDSHSNEKQSHGYFQYRVKPLKNLAEGTKIHNTAYIFFDYNKPVVTNTTVNSFVTVPILGIQAEKISETFQLYPNPGSGIFTVDFDQDISSVATVEIYDLYGALLFSCPYSSEGVQLDMRAFANGFYICKLNTGSRELYRTFVKQ